VEKRVKFGAHSTEPASIAVHLGVDSIKREDVKKKKVSNRAILNPISSIYKFSIAARFNFANLGIRQQKLLKVGVRQEMCVYVSNNNDRIAKMPKMNGFKLYQRITS
jgi:hypothetical protein